MQTELISKITNEKKNQALEAPLVQQAVRELKN